MTDMGFIADEVCDMVCDLTEMVKLMAVEKPDDEGLTDLADTVTDKALMYLNKVSKEMNLKGAGAKIMDYRQRDYEDGKLSDKELAQKLVHIFGKQTMAEINARIKADNEAWLRAHT